MEDMIGISEAYKLVDSAFISRLIERGQLEILNREWNSANMKDLYLDEYTLSQIDYFSKVIDRLRGRTFFKSVLKTICKVFYEEGEDVCRDSLHDLITHHVVEDKGTWIFKPIYTKPLFILLDEILTPGSGYLSKFTNKLSVPILRSYYIQDCYSNTPLGQQNTQVFRALEIVRSELDMLYLESTYIDKDYTVKDSCVGFQVKGTWEVFDTQYKIDFQNSKVNANYIENFNTLPTVLSYVSSSLIDISESGSTGVGVLNQDSMSRLNELLEKSPNFKTKVLGKSAIDLYFSDDTLPPTDKQPTEQIIKISSTDSIPTQEFTSKLQTLLDRSLGKKSLVRIIYKLDSSEVIVQSNQGNLCIQNNPCSDAFRGISGRGDGSQIIGTVRVNFSIDIKSVQGNKYRILLIPDSFRGGDLTIDEFLDSIDIQEILNHLGSIHITAWRN